MQRGQAPPQPGSDRKYATHNATGGALLRWASTRPTRTRHTLVSSTAQLSSSMDQDQNEVPSPGEPAQATPDRTIEGAPPCFLREAVEEFYLDDEAAPEIQGTPAGISFPRWMPITHCDDKRPSLILLAGETLVVPVAIECDARLYVRYCAALPEISSDGLVCEIAYRDGARMGGEPSVLCELPILGGLQTPFWRTSEFDLSFLAGKQVSLAISCRPGPLGDPSADWLAISDLCFARADRLTLVRAQSFHKLRSRNEIEHFSAVYRHSMYSEVQDSRAEATTGRLRATRRLGTREVEVPSELGFIQGDVSPQQGEAAFEYASRLLGSCIRQAPPDFGGRLKSRARARRGLKVLSLCSGAARIEADFAATASREVWWSLLDMNADLLGLASLQFSSGTRLDLIEANVNELNHSGEKWDVILCVSALHHVVELERVMRFCHDSLNDGGEFWSIGEYVGRNGSRLWPEARYEADKLFRQMPERYRLNHHTNRTDEELPDNDCSVSTFEGIRSEEIEGALDKWFSPVDVYRRNCFLWRLVNLAYADNFDIRKPEDRSWIIRMVNAELSHFRSGGRATELNGVYRPRFSGAALRPARASRFSRFGRRVLGLFSR